ncbi:uncharacterized protein ACA1_188760 [Acanthamoeba castellanii str. Neff]|uniref:Uncharacterized protein n=1 Tax=Acanthamoeba castellanii (strain ATCC 30010 / Neff) TaxID=1257118 RepID=L8GTI5_ACACF|nr:uncharacterized protein ACA1_188760 [Acanthamoeba castellanii str. Neff]ELR15918.1 hypothetical protein ACA1_188760 [Acanthamoeba castellanii str. Neff]
MKKRKERPKSPALSTTTIDAYYSKSAHNAPRAASPATQAPAMVVGGLPASVWRHALRFVDNKSLAQNVCRVNRIFQRLGMRVLRERERHSRTERQKQQRAAAAAAKNATDPGLFSSGHFVDGDDDDEEEEEKNEDDIPNHGDHGVANIKTKSPTTLRSKKDGPRPAEVIVVHASPTPSLAAVVSPKSPTTNASRKSEETALTSPRRKKNEASGSKEAVDFIIDHLFLLQPCSPHWQHHTCTILLNNYIFIFIVVVINRIDNFDFAFAFAFGATGGKTKSRHFWSCNHPLPHLRCGFHSWVATSTNTTTTVGVAEVDQRPAKATAQPTPTEPLPPPPEKAAAETEAEAEAAGAEAKVAPPSPTILERMRRLEQMRSDSTLIINILGKRRNSREAATTTTTTTMTTGGSTTNPASHEADPPQPQPQEPTSADDARDPANAKRKKVRVDKQSQHQTTTTTTSKQRVNSVVEVLVGCSEDQTAATLNYSQLFISPHTVRETQEEGTAYDMETLPYTLAPAFNPDSCPPLSFNLNLALKEPLAAAHDDDEHHDQQPQKRDAEAPYVADRDANADAGDDDNLGNVDNKEVDDPLLTMRSSPSVSATALPAAALGEAEPKAKLKPQPVGGIHEWSTELDETEPYSLSASLSPSTPVPTTTTTTTTSSSGSSTAEPPTKESNEAEAAAASTHHPDEAEVKETAATTPKSAGGALLLPSREDEPSEDLLHSNFECVDQAAASGGDELEALRAEMRTLHAQLEACQSRNEALERENEQLRRGRDRDRDLLTSFHLQLAHALHQHQP